MSQRWSNWSGSVTCTPQIMASPRSEEALAATVARAARAERTVRVVGTGHSFTPLCATDGLLLSLDNLQGMIAANPDEQTATFWAGTKFTRWESRCCKRGWPWRIWATSTADDIWLSPAYGRATVTISIHQAAELPHHGFFSAAENIFRTFQGRPHWGKLNAMTREEAQQTYPRMDNFVALRAKLDPDSLFGNAYLEHMFGVRA